MTTKKKKPMPLGRVVKQRVENAMELALAELAKRTVLAEAREKIAQAELAVTKDLLRAAEHRASENDWAHRRMWLMFWATMGVPADQLIKYRVEYMREAKEEAERLAYNTSGYYPAPYERGEVRELAGRVTIGADGYYHFAKLTKPE